MPQGRLVFHRLTVEENFRLGAWLLRDRRAVEQRLREVFEAHPALAAKRRQRAGQLSGGEQQLAMARSLMHRPRLLLLDESILGLAPQVTAEIFRDIQRCHGTGLPLVIVEQNVLVALRLADRGYVLVNGQVRYEGTPETLLNPVHLRELFSS